MAAPRGRDPSAQKFGNALAVGQGVTLAGGKAAVDLDQPAD